MTRYAYALILIALIAGCGKTANIPPTGQRLANVPVEGFKALKVEDLEPGKGEPAKKGDTIIVFYRGTFVDGIQFDANMDAAMKPDLEKDPFSLTVGAGMIKGWNDGLVGVKEGMVRKLSVPWVQAYGENGDGGKIPAKSDMIFTVKVMKVYRANPPAAIEVENTKMGTGAVVTEKSTIKFKYQGKLLNGRVFDDQSKKVLECPVSRLIPGFKESIIGMKAGGQRKISLPPGSPNPTGQIPSGQPIEYILDLISVKL